MLREAERPLSRASITACYLRCVGAVINECNPILHSKVVQSPESSVQIAELQAIGARCVCSRKSRFSLMGL